MLALVAPVIALAPPFSYGRVPAPPQFVVWGVAVAVILIATEYARRSSRNR